MIDIGDKCCTDIRNNDKEYEYIICFIIDKKETDIKQLVVQSAKSKSHARLKFMRKIIEFRNWEFLEIIDIFRR